MIVIDNVNNLDLCNTITCGQIFRFEVLDDGAYIVVLKDRVINIFKAGKYLCVLFK